MSRRRAPARLACAWSVAIHVLLATSAVRAETDWEPGPRSTGRVDPQVTDPGPESDGVYGRFGGDVSLEFGAGAQLSGQGPGLRLTSAAYFLSTAGLELNYADVLDDEDAQLQRRLDVVIGLRPLFLPRWALGMQSGPAWLDLTLDSLGLGLGASFAQGVREQTSFASSRGLVAALSMGVPLTGSANGPFLQFSGGLTFWDRRAGRANFPTRYAALSIVWHQVVNTPLTSGPDR